MRTELEEDKLLLPPADWAGAGVPLAHEGKYVRFPTTGFEDVVVSQQLKLGASLTNRSLCLFYNFE